MMTLNNILKKVTISAFIGCAILLSANIALAAGTKTLSGKANCKATSKQDTGSTCSTVQKIAQSSSSPLAQNGTECSTGNSSCVGSNVKSTAYYQTRDQNSCFNSMPAQGAKSISSVVGMRPTSIGATASSCVLDEATGVKMRQHAGMDVSANCGTNLTAPADGYISGVSWHCKGTGDAGAGSGAGNYVVIKHPLNPNDAGYNKDCQFYYTRFFHLNSDLKPMNGKAVSKGTIIGHVGSSNCSGGEFNPKGYACHMHMELHKCKADGPLLNPLCANNQNLCNGAQKVDVKPEDAATTPQLSSYGSQAVELEDCDQYDPDKKKEKELAKCNADFNFVTDYQRNKACIDAVNKKYPLYLLPDKTEYNACIERNRQKNMAAGNYAAALGGSWQNNGGFSYNNSNPPKAELPEYESNYKCNLSDYYNSIEGCMFCDLFKILFNSASAVARSCYNRFASSMGALLAIGLAISLAMIVLRNVSEMTRKDTGKMLNDIFRKIFVVAFIMLLLKLDVTEFFNVFVTPIFVTGFNLASLVMDSAVIKDFGVDGSGLPAEMGNSMISAIYAVQERLERIMALGSHSLCIAFYVKSYKLYVIFPHFGYLLTGLFLWLIAIVFMVCYPFLLIDSVLQFTIASALFPVALAATAFPITYKYLNIFKVLNIFMKAMFVFIFLTIVLFILLTGIDNTVMDLFNETYNSSTASGGIFDLNTLGWYSKAFVKLVFFLFLGKSVLEDLPSFGEKFGSAITLGESSGKSDLGIGRKVGGMAMGAATKGTTQIAAPLAKAGLSGLNKTRKVVGGAVGEAVRTARQDYLIHVTQQRMAAAEAAGGTPGGFVEGRTWWGQRVRRRVIQNADGSLALETQRRGIFNKNRQYNITENELMSVKTSTNSSGLKKDDLKINAAFAKSLINSDGTRNDVAVQQLMNTAGLTEDQKNKIILNQMLKQRLPNSNEAHLEGEYKSEQIRKGKDEQGREYFEVRRVNDKNEVQVFRITKGKERDLIEYEKIKTDGKSTKWSSDGIIQKKEQGEYDLNDDGTVNLENQVTVNGAEIKNTTVDASGRIVDKDGKTIGEVQANGNIVDEHNNVIGTADVKDLAFDKDGKAIGKINSKGEIVDNSGNVKARIDADGNIIDERDETKVLGRVAEDKLNEFYNALDAKKMSRKVEFSNSKAYKGVKIFDDDGIIEDSMAEEELMLSDSDLELYKKQMKKYGDVLSHHRFGR